MLFYKYPYVSWNFFHDPHCSLICLHSCSTKKKTNLPTRFGVNAYDFKKPASGKAHVAKSKLHFLGFHKNLGITAFCMTSSALASASSSSYYQQ